MTSRPNHQQPARSAKFFWILGFSIAVFIGLLSPAAHADTVLAPSIPVGNTPFGVAITPNGQYAYITNWGSGTVTVIETATNTVADTITVGARPEGLVIAPDGKHVYVNDNGDGSVSVIDTATNAVVDTWAVGHSPYGIAITPEDGKFLYVVNNTTPGTVSVIDTASGALADTITVGNQPADVAITPDGNFAYVANSSDGTVSVIDTASHDVVQTITVSTTDLNLYDVAFTPDGRYAYVTDEGGSTVSVIDTAIHAVLTTISVPGNLGVAVTPDGKFAYVATTRSSVSVIDTATNTIVNTLSIGSSTYYVAITLDGQFAYVTDLVGPPGAVSVIALDPVITANLPDGTVNVAYASTIKVANASSTAFSVSGDLPDGLNLDPSTGALTGTPTTVGSSAFTVTATSTINGLQAVITQQYTLVVKDAPSTTNTTAIPTLSDLALTLLALLLGASAVAAHRRRR